MCCAYPSYTEALYCPHSMKNSIGNLRTAPMCDNVSLYRKMVNFFIYFPVILVDVKQ